MARSRSHPLSRRKTLPLRDRAGLVQTFPDAVAAIDGDGRIVFVNPAFESLLGHASSEVLGRGLATLLVNGERLPAAGSSIVRLRRRDGRTRTVEMSFGHALSIHGGRHLLSVVFHDGQGRREREAARRRTALLTEASAILAAGRGTTTFPALTVAIASAYSGTCAIDLRQPDGTLRREACARAGDLHAPQADESRDVIAETMRTARTRVEIRAPEQGGGFLVVAPLSWSTRTVGVLTCVTTEPLAEEDLAVTEQIARQAALAIAQADLLSRALSRIGQGWLRREYPAGDALRPGETSERPKTTAG